MIVPAVYNGPPGSGNGGWCSGLFSALAPGAAATVTRLAGGEALGDQFGRGQASKR